MKLLKVWTFSLLVLALLVTACAPAATPQPAATADNAAATPAASGENVELTFNVWGDPEELNILQELADDAKAVDYIHDSRG